MLQTHPPFLEGREATASPCRVDKAWANGNGAYEGSDINADWLLTDEGRRGEWPVRRTGAPVEGKSPVLMSGIRCRKIVCVNR